MYEFKELPSLNVEIEQVLYLPGMHAPSDWPHPFAYYIKVTNLSDQKLRILGRKWVIEEDGNPVLVVEGDGVVGQTPELSHGDEFSYNSHHFIRRNSRVNGTLFAVTENDQPVYARVPRFKLKAPAWNS